MLGAVLLAPVLPRIQDAFENTAGVEALTPIVLTAPALVIGLTATFAGPIVDRVGRKRLLVGALVAYAFVGTAPLWLPSLELIVVSRVLVGLTEAAIMTCCTTLLADYFDGSQRDRYFGLQVVYTTVAATIFFAVGGALGAQNWRTPFWLYAVSLPLAFFAAKYIWQPAPQALHRTGEAAGSAVAPAGRAGRRDAARRAGLLRPGRGAVVQARREVSGPRRPSVRCAVASLGTAVGAFLFGRLATFGPAVLVPLSFGISGIGLIGPAVAPSVPVVVVAAVVTGFGNGLLLPSLLTWALGSLTFEQRGRGTGVWTSALFIGQLVAPLVVLALSGAIDGLTSALLVLGAVAVVAAVGVRLARPVQAVEPALAGH